MSGRHRRERPPTHLLDQIAAAERDAEGALRHVAEHFEVRVMHRESGDPDDPILDGLLAELRLQAALRMLGHCPHVGSPQPLMLNLWDRPRMLRCVPCNAALPGLSSEQDNTCDACGRFDATGTWPSQVLLGVIVVSMGRCDDCTPAQVRAGEHRL